MKSPALIIWAQSIRKRMVANQEQVTADKLAARMILEDRDEVRDWYFGRIPPKNVKDIADIENRIATLFFVAHKLVMH